MNISRTRIAAAFAVILFNITALPRCLAADNKSGDIFNSIDAALCQEYSALAKKPSSVDYSISQTTFRAGGKGGTRFFFTDTLNKIKKDSGSRKFSTDVRAKEYGVILATRFSSLPGQSFEFGASHREVHTSTYKDYTWMALAGAWNVDTVGQAEVYSTPIYFNYKYALSKATTLTLALASNNVKLDTPGNLSVRTRVYEISAAHKAKNFGYSLSISRLKAKQLSGNTHLSGGVTRGLTPNLTASLSAGMYTHGAPTAGGVFSPVGEQFVFSYLGGETAFDPVYTKKIGYVTLGMTLHTK